MHKLCINFTRKDGTEGIREGLQDGSVDNGCQPPCLTFWRNGAWDTEASTLFFACEAFASN